MNFWRDWEITESRSGGERLEKYLHFFAFFACNVVRILPKRRSYRGEP